MPGWVSALPCQRRPLTQCFPHPPAPPSPAPLALMLGVCLLCLPPTQCLYAVLRVGAAGGVPGCTGKRLKEQDKNELTAHSAPHARLGVSPCGHGGERGRGGAVERRTQRLQQHFLVIDCAVNSSFMSIWPHHPAFLFLIYSLTHALTMKHLLEARCSARSRECSDDEDGFPCTTRLLGLQVGPAPPGSTARPAWKTLVPPSNPLLVYHLHPLDPGSKPSSGKVPWPLDQFKAPL